MQADTESKQFVWEQSEYQSWLRQYERDGFVVIENVLSDAELSLVKSELQPYLDKNVTGRNNFEGVRSNRIYATLNKSAAVAELCQHPLALRFAEAELGASCLLSACLAINLLPGESVQPWHYDTGHLEIPRPRSAYGVSTFWALDETTDTNGATEVIPGSHLWGAEVPAGALDDEHFEAHHLEHEDDVDRAEGAIKITMPAGSLMIAKGTLWHRGGANQSDAPRLIITPQYCPGWSRQLENMMAAVSQSKVATLPERVQQLIGYSIHPPFMGYVDGVHPARVLSDK